MKRDRFNKSERDAGGKPLHTFAHPAPEHFQQKWVPILRPKML
jgi:hypothetical protein